MTAWLFNVKMNLPHLNLGSNPNVRLHTFRWIENIRIQPFFDELGQLEPRYPWHWIQLSRYHAFNRIQQNLQRVWRTLRNNQSLNQQAVHQVFNYWRSWNRKRGYQSKRYRRLKWSVTRSWWTSHFKLCSSLFELIFKGIRTFRPSDSQHGWRHSFDGRISTSSRRRITQILLGSQNYRRRMISYQHISISSYNLS